MDINLCIALFWIGFIMLIFGLVLRYFFPKYDRYGKNDTILSDDSHTICAEHAIKTYDGGKDDPIWIDKPKGGADGQFLKLDENNEPIWVDKEDLFKNDQDPNGC